MEESRRQRPNGSDDPAAVAAEQIQRLMRDALGAASGFASEADHHREGYQCVGPCPICRAADVIRAATPPEFQHHWQALQREFLLATQALVGHYLRRMDEQRSATVEVEDIPID